MLAFVQVNGLHAADGIAVFPGTIKLSTPRAQQRLVVERMVDGQYLGQVSEGIEWISHDPQIVTIENQHAVPRANGRTRIEARWQGHAVTAEVIIDGQHQPFVWNFRNHVESVLSKTGCNSGACHGARAGQKGFRLTLFGFNLEADYAYLTRQARGRRIIPEDPGRSLILTKPTGLIPHKGGIRFEVGSTEYQVLAEWIAAGSPGPADDDPVIERLEVLPHASRQKAGSIQQLVVLAHFNDGHVEDVTRWAKYTSVNSSVATVTTDGEISVRGSGEGAVKVWYLNLNEMAFVTVPYDNPAPQQQFAATTNSNFIDGLITEKLASLQLPPSPQCRDDVFIRRVFLDTIGTLPTIDETRRFLEDNHPAKRDTLIDALLARPEFVDYWAYRWSDLLLVNSEKLDAASVKSYYGWIRERVAEDTPWDQMVSQVITATGSTKEYGAANFYTLHQSPEEMAETVSQAFMGLSIQCAKCHNHPLEKWTNDQYYGFANMFARVRAKGNPRVVFADTRGELIQPATGRAQPPRPLDATAIPFTATQDRRIALGAWLTAADNPYFSRSISNRIWANFFGVGLVEPIDDMRITNPASNERLLHAVSRFLVSRNFRLKELIRTIVQSAAYQRSSQATRENAADHRFYSRYYPRRMKAEVLLDALSQVTQIPTAFKDHPRGLRALQLPDSNINSYFLTTFGRPERVITCACERSDEPSITQVFHLYNGDTVNGKLQAPDSIVGQIVGQINPDHPDAMPIEQAYLAALSRAPSESEAKQLLKVFQATPAVDRRLLIEDLYWSILSSREFLFNH
ncbi:MAG: S-layer protein [Planctomycetaceae bacterium]|nr:S-layer protein [Planctomycetaceae bacterium]